MSVSSGSGAPESASLLRRLAEAADGYRDGQRRVVVASRQFPHRIAGVFLESQTNEIGAALDSAGPGYEAFGPFVTPLISPVQGQRQVVSVTVNYDSGPPDNFAANAYDALVWSVPAFDKLLAPYLTLVSGLDQALQERQAFISATTLLKPHDLHSL